MTTVTKTRYPDVYKDEKGKFLYQMFLGRDAKGKKHFKKSRKDSLKRPFTSARPAHIEAQRIKQVYLNVNLCDMTYASFIKETFLPKYKSDVEGRTYETHSKMFLHAIDFLGNITLKKLRLKIVKSIGFGY